jgi:hypothetical protein
MTELLYYLRDVPLPIVVWPRGPVPRDHFEMTRPYTSATPEPLLYATLRQRPDSVTRRFGTATLIGEQRLPEVGLCVRRASIS